MIQGSCQGRCVAPELAVGEGLQLNGVQREGSSHLDIAFGLFSVALPEGVTAGPNTGNVLSDFRFEVKGNFRLIYANYAPMDEYESTARRKMDSLVSMVFALSGAALANEKLSFISVNDTLPPELINVTTVHAGVTYVPYWLFTNYGLGVYYAYFSNSDTAYLYNADRQLYFNLSEGKTYDEGGYHYTAPALVRNGTVYLPLGFMSSYFGGFS